MGAQERAAALEQARTTNAATLVIEALEGEDHEFGLVATSAIYRIHGALETVQERLRVQARTIKDIRAIVHYYDETSSSVAPALLKELKEALGL
jgi:hypothetical protein